MDNSTVLTERQENDIKMIMKDTWSEIINTSMIMIANGNGQVKAFAKYSCHFCLQKKTHKIKRSVNFRIGGAPKLIC